VGFEPTPPKRLVP